MMDVGLTFKGHLRNIILDTIFHESLKREITCLLLLLLLFYCFPFYVLLYLFVGIAVYIFVFLWDDTSVFHGMTDMEAALSLQHQQRGIILNYNGLQPMELISLH